MFSMSKMFKMGALGILLVAGIAHQVRAEGDVYLCVDDTGHKEYKNTGGTKGCKKVELPGITTVPGFKRVTPQSATKSPADYPRVDADTQKSRDGERKQILQDELKNEEQKLAALQKAYNGGEPERLGDERNYAKYQERVAQMKDEIARSEKNIEALKRELSGLK